MAADELLLLHSPDISTCGCEPVRRTQQMSGADRTCAEWKNVYSPATGGYVRRCARMARRRRSLGEIGQLSLGNPGTLKGTLSDVKGVIFTSAVAVGGAVLTDKLFTLIAKNWNVTGWKRYTAEAATGIALGIMVGKFLKRPQLAAAIAVGPVVLAGLKAAGELLNAGPLAPQAMAGLGMVSVEPYYQQPFSGQGAEQLGAMQVGPGVPNWMYTPENEIAGATVGSY